LADATGIPDAHSGSLTAGIQLMKCLLFSTLSSCLILVHAVDLNLLIVFFTGFHPVTPGPIRNSVDRSIKTTF